MKLIDPEEYKNAPDGDATYAAIKLKTPKRVLHFSDGILEEYSDDEVDSSSTLNQEKNLVDPATLTWGPWTWYKLWSAGSSTLGYLDTAGEFMASVLGITTPKYYFELEEYKRKQNSMAADEASRKGWSEPASSATAVVDMEFTDIRTSQPAPPIVV